jgi:hypothetical protein
MLQHFIALEKSVQFNTVVLYISSFSFIHSFIYSLFIYLSIDLFIYCFTSFSRIFHLYGDITITGEGLQNLGVCSAFRASEQGGIFIVPHLLASVFLVPSKAPLHAVASYNTQGDVDNLF